MCVWLPGSGHLGFNHFCSMRLWHRDFNCFWRSNALPVECTSVCQLSGIFRLPWRSVYLCQGVAPPPRLLVHRLVQCYQCCHKRKQTHQHVTCVHICLPKDIAYLLVEKKYFFRVKTCKLVFLSGLHCEVTLWYFHIMVARNTVLLCSCTLTEECQSMTIASFGGWQT